MVKIKFLRYINFGKLESDGDLIYGKLGQELDVPDREPYSTVIANAVEDGFIEILKETQESKESKKKK